jgi:hypothetical protein
MMSSQRRALTVLLDDEHEPERPEASHAAGPIGLVGRRRIARRGQPPL